ncbi:MAG: OmpA family protein [Bacteroidetes bacterium]|nr:OmpA family protein [Bacteroidota bacterium]
MKTKTLLCLMAILMTSFIVIAQEDEKPGKIKKKTVSQKTAINKSWSIGVFGGVPIVFGDVNPEYMAYGYGINIKKAVSNNLELRFQASNGFAFGVDRKYANANMIQSNPALNGVNDAAINFFNNPPTPAYTYYNYKMTFYEANFHVVYNFAFNDFRMKEDPRVNYFLFIGAGGLMFKTYTDQLNSFGSLYSFSTVYNDYVAGNINQSESQDRVSAMLDREYETAADGNPDGNGFAPDPQFLSHTMLANINGGIGVRFKLGSRIDLSLESKASFCDNDLLDGQRFDRLTYGLSANNDILLFTTLGINIRLGALNNVYWFDNPAAMHYKVTLENKRKISLLSSDIDNDGVSDYFDKDLETPEGVKVDVNGKALDTDGDGIADYLDKEPFSDVGAIVNEEGISIDTDEDGVPDHRDLDPNTDKDMLVNFQGVPIGGKGSMSGIRGGSLGFLPAIFFSFDNASVKTEFLSHLSLVAEAMKNNTGANLRVIGYTDPVGSADYNHSLGLRRAQAVINLLSLQGVDASRFEAVSKGATEPLTDVRSADANRLNRRVQFEIISGSIEPPVDTDMEESIDVFEEVPTE